MQLSFRTKEQLFHELSSLLGSGIPFPKALEIMGRGSSSKLSRWAAHASRLWESTGSLPETFRLSGLAPRDAAIMEAGHNSGRLPEVFEELSRYYAELAKGRRMILSRSAYPLITFHLGVLLLSIPGAILGHGLWTYLVEVIPPLFGLYICLGLFIGGIRLILNLAATNPAVSASLRRTPLLGGFYSAWTGWNFGLIASLYMRAGGSFIGALKAAGLASGDAGISSNTASALESVREGRGLADSYARLPLAGSLHRAFATGESSGRLEEELSRAAQSLRDETVLKLDLFCQWLPRLLYALIVIFTFWQMVSMANTVGNTINDAVTIPE